MSPTLVTAPLVTAPLVTVAIVTHDSAADLPSCFAALAAQTRRDFEVVVVDCQSADESVETARRADLGGVPLAVVPLLENRGFAGGMNVAFKRTKAPYFLTLNADASPRPDFLERLLERAETSRAAPWRLGAVTPRLVRPARGGEAPRLDACGMVLLPAWRHLDRGSGEIDRGQYSAPERVFGATGAAAFFLREALVDVALEDGVFDPLFHSFREDAELCFRLQERGFEVVYEPAAVALHRRRVLPERRAALPAFVNYSSLKNRYLLRAYHQTRGNFLRTFVSTLARDLLALGWVVLRERSSLPAYRWLWQNRRVIAARRRYIQGRRTVAPNELERWFYERSLPLEAP